LRLNLHDQNQLVWTKKWQIEAKPTRPKSIGLDQKVAN